MGTQFMPSVRCGSEDTTRNSFEWNETAACRLLLTPSSNWPAAGGRQFQAHSSSPACPPHILIKPHNHQRSLTTHRDFHCDTCAFGTIAGLRCACFASNSSLLFLFVLTSVFHMLFGCLQLVQTQPRPFVISGLAAAGDEKWPIMSSGKPGLWTEASNHSGLSPPSHFVSFLDRLFMTSGCLLTLWLWLLSLSFFFPCSFLNHVFIARLTPNVDLSSPPLSPRVL